MERISSFFSPVEFLFSPVDLSVLTSLALLLHLLPSFHFFYFAPMLIPPISLGLLATIKDHITKPTAMAQGRVAHLIEWKSWGGEATSRGSWCGWTKDGGGWGGVGAALQEDEQLYSHLTDEIKEARFAAGETAFIYLTCSCQVLKKISNPKHKTSALHKSINTVISCSCYLMRLTSSALRKVMDRGRIFPSFLSTLTALHVCLLVTC